MIPSRFAYAAPESAEAAVALLAEDPDGGRVLGGGTWVVPELSRGDSRPRLVVDLRRAGLAGIRARAGRVHVGAMCTYADLLASDVVAQRLPLLRIMAQGVTGGRQILGQGTVGGSLVAARPSSDAPGAVVALGGEAVIACATGERRCPALELLAGAMETTLGQDEILVGFEFPAEAAGVGYVKLKRGVSSWPIATAACLIQLDEGGRWSSVSLVLGGVAPTPVEVDLGGLLGTEPDGEAISAGARLAGTAVTEPWTDELAPGEYRASVAGPVARRALELACADAIGRKAADGS
jgi:carbon-monoxide dehydrogenase medium subunit